MVFLLKECVYYSLLLKPLFDYWNSLFYLVHEYSVILKNVSSIVGSFTFIERSDFGRNSGNIPWQQKPFKINRRPLPWLYTPHLCTTSGWVTFEATTMGKSPRIHAVCWPVYLVPGKKIGKKWVSWGDRTEIWVPQKILNYKGLAHFKVLFYFLLIQWLAKK